MVIIEQMGRVGNNMRKTTEQVLPHINHTENITKQTFGMKMSCKELQKLDNDKHTKIHGHI